MSRIIKTQSVLIRGLKLMNCYTDNTVDYTEFYEDDIIENLRYISGDKINNITGRLSKINMQFVNSGRVINKEHENYFERDSRITSIIMDYSEPNHSKLSDILYKDILEYNHNTNKEISRVKLVPNIKVKASSLLSDGSYSEIILDEGMELVNVTIWNISTKYNKWDTVTGNFKILSFIYDIIDNNTDIVVDGMYITDGEEIYKVNFSDVKSFGKIGMIIEEGVSLSEILSNHTGEEGYILPSATFNEELLLQNEVILAGAKSNVSAASGIRCSDETLEDETILNNTISCDKGASVIISGVTITENAKINLNGAKQIRFKNCRFVNMTADKEKSFLLYDVFSETNTEGTLIQIEDCYFGTNHTVDSNIIYNLFELNCKVADGSYIKNCYFAKEVCANNIINLYDVVDGATINIIGNHFEISKNAIRIGFIGEPECTVNIMNNIYDETDMENPEYAGILLIQPYGKKTTSYAKLIINLKNNVCKAGDFQEWYLHCGKNDTQIEGNLLPVVNILD